MGYSCFSCSEPFEESPNRSTTQKGGGDGPVDAKGRSVSAISKCGHMFHTDCLKKVLETQSGNAWVAKSCPVCQVVVTMNDLVRVHANPFDSRSHNRPRIDVLIERSKNLQKQLEEVCRSYDILRGEMREKELENDDWRRRYDELIGSYEQLMCANNRSKSDIERQNADIEKLKNIIVKLTGKLTGSETQMHEYYGGNLVNNNNGNVAHHRLEYTEELKRMSMAENGGPINGCVPKMAQHHHPPGFLYPVVMPMENQGELQDHETMRQRLALSPQPNVKLPPTTVGVNPFANGIPIVQMTDDNQQMGRVTCFALQDMQVRDYNSHSNSAPTNMTRDDEFPLMQGASSELTHDESLVTATSGTYSSKCSNGIKAATGKSNGVNLSAASTENAKKIDKQDDEDYVETHDALDTWHETKSRRRGGSKNNGTSRGRRASAKSEPTSEKKLLYGSFSCPTCKAKWGSSQSVLNTPQTCRYCNTEVLPYSQGPILSRKQLEDYKQQSASNTTSATVTTTDIKKQPNSKKCLWV